MTNRWFGCEGQAGGAGDGLGDNSMGFCLGGEVKTFHMLLFALAGTWRGKRANNAA